MGLPIIKRQGACLTRTLFRSSKLAQACGSFCWFPVAMRDVSNSVTNCFHSSLSTARHTFSPDM
ncbi:hypothetical protein JMJ77_0013640 [Colletotrichum scovillei]|uniref:Uncharacterized protein n=1 Tax=Colletotrichum scovillei TaxID=1209932 RepID=A0A9P7QQE8_9PEZI|nr:hypothetical protein JMJ78_0012929 [Colletotrichum scovillei]KAG7040643.1 hypothetical protein JMJ77_0013640 [Colletotrichum scovillei]KAG7060690.1 hypothetical protein JMJ76_0006233 [Colletotrichum scovillei]